MLLNLINFPQIPSVIHFFFFIFFYQNQTNLFSFLLCLQVKLNVLDKNDSPPVFRDEPIVFTVSEDLSPGHSVGTIRATDQDTIGSLSFALIGGDDKKFTLDKNSGILKLIDTLDRETKEVYKLNVRVSDGVQNTDTIVSIQVCGNKIK